ncbi:MAG: replicative DNA helicase [Lachnospiraceae bacterium]|nr:replicative DNA helicase [Lachnospiraceae bacterium]MDY5742920.1 replicative DNA helicase [Lachnospiraceae bacterium]
MAEEDILRRTMPQSIEAEQATIGAMLMDREAVQTAAEILQKDDFYYKKYGVIFEAMVDLYNSGKPIDLVTLGEKLKEMDMGEDVIGAEVFQEIISATATSSNVGHYANIVQEKSMRRRLIRLNDELSNLCYKNEEGLDDILDTTEKKMFALLNSRNTSQFVPIKEIVLTALDRIEHLSKLSGAVTGVPTGFTDLDYRTAGLQPSDLILVAARPSMGKTAFVLNIAEYAAVRSPKKVTTAIFSLEMSKEQLTNRLLSMESHVDAQALRTGNLEDAQWEQLVEGASMVADSALIIDDTGSISISELRSKCRKYKLEYNLGLVIIDYLQLMSGGKAESRQQEISSISRALKGLARELNVPVIALSQLSRAVESRPDKRPMLSDLRESGAIEQDADVVMFIYRDEYYNKDESEDKGKAEIIIAKQRNGPVGTVKLKWDPQYTRFSNLQRETDYEN